VRQASLAEVKGVEPCNRQRKLWIAAQRVQVPPPEGLASRRVASVAWTSVTAAAKRTQRANGPRDRSPKLSHRARPTSLGRRRQHEVRRQGETHRGAPGTQSAARAHGQPRNLGDLRVSAPNHRVGSAEIRARPRRAVDAPGVERKSIDGKAVPVAEPNEAPGRIRRSPSLPYERRSWGTELTGTQWSKGQARRWTREKER
jgi:hypothetical protein